MGRKSDVAQSDIKRAGFAGEDADGQHQDHDEEVRRTELDVQHIRALLKNADDVLEESDGMRVGLDFDRGRGLRQDPDAAALSRDLLRVADLLQLAAGEVARQYWQVKGYPDPLNEAEDD